MKLTYPPVTETSFSDAALAFKIARHTPCAACDTCHGLRPPPDVQVVLDDQDSRKSSLGALDQYGSDEDDEPAYLCTCICGHEVADHGADERVTGREEFARRGRLAIRLDEMLQASRHAKPVLHGLNASIPHPRLAIILPVWLILTGGMHVSAFQEVDRLLDFDYSDDDIFSLRQQMKLPVSLITMHSPSVGKICRRCAAIHRSSQFSVEHSSPVEQVHSPGSSILSDGGEPPAKRRRLSLSSLSDADEEEEEEEDKPLAAQVFQPQPPDTPARKSNKRTGKKMSSMKSKSQSAPTSSKQPDMNGVNGHIPDAKVKVEDKMDESQLTRLATGVTIDAGPSSTTHVSNIWPVRDPSAHNVNSIQPPPKTEKAAFVELRKGIIQVTAVENDGTPRSLVILTGLKTLFRTQLPMMPREYIARLVYDSNSKALAIIKRGYKVVGGICYRPFPHRAFAEIVFFATASVDQVKVCPVQS